MEFVVPTQYPRKTIDPSRPQTNDAMWSLAGTPLSHFDARNQIITYSPCGSSSDGSENSYMQKLDGVSQSPPLYSRKVFVGGLPPDISEDEIILCFQRFGPLSVNWPQKGEKKSIYPPKGYAFLIFDDEQSVQRLVANCYSYQSMLYLSVSSNNCKNKPVQVRPWNLSDKECILDKTVNVDLRKTVFVGGVPRPLKAMELAHLMNERFQNVCNVAIDTDPELHYPKGAARVTFSNQDSYVAAINKRFVTLSHADIEKRVELKPYVLGYQECDVCLVQNISVVGPFFCASITCLKYYCEMCWARNHSSKVRKFHKPVVKEWADRPRKLPYRSC